MRRLASTLDRKGVCSALLPRVQPGASTQPIYIRTERQTKITSAASYQNWFYIEDPIEVGLELIEVEPQDRWWKDQSLIATANDSAGDIVQRTWARFRPEDEGPSDFLVLLEFEKRRSQVRARGHIMISSETTALEDLAQRSSYMRQEAFGKQCASNGALSVHVAMEQDTITGQEMFVVKLVKITSFPDVTVNATFELEVLALMLELESTMKDGDELLIQAANLDRMRKEKMSAVESVKGRLTVIEEQIRKLNEEKILRADTLNTERQEIQNIITKGEVIRHKRVELSTRRLSTQGRLDSLLQTDSSDATEEVLVADRHQYPQHISPLSLPTLYSNQDSMSNRYRSVREDCSRGWRIISRQRALFTAFA